MRGELDRFSRWRQRGLQAGIAMAGLLAIVGSGGGGVGCIPFDAPCPGDSFPVPETPPTPTATMVRSRVTTTVGGSATFEVRTSNIAQPTYQWCRVAPGASSCEAIPGATGPTYTVTGANLTDDDSVYQVAVGGGWLPATSAGRLAVSSMPGVAYQDGEFLETDWDVTAIVDPPLNGPSFTAQRVQEGGNPGAFRSASYDLSSVPSSVRIFYSARSAIYDPAANGPIYTIDFAEDCVTTSSTYLPYTVPLLEQGGRRFVANITLRQSCNATSWQVTPARRSLVAADFVQVDGTACGLAESCPDFSASGSPIGLGLVSAASLRSGLPPGAVAQFGQGFDNWRVTVWRK